MKTKQNVFFGFAVLMNAAIFTLLLSGCMSVKLNTKYQDSSLPIEEHSRLYVYFGIKGICGLDGKMSSGSYLVKENSVVLLPPGQHTTNSMTVGYYIGGSYYSTRYPGIEITRNYEPGHTYILKIPRGGTAVSRSSISHEIVDLNEIPDAERQIYESFIVKAK